MLQSGLYPIKITTSGYEVIASGLVHLTEPELKIELSGLKIKYRFSSDNEGTRLSSDIIDNELILTLYNFNNPLGEGKLDPIEIGNIGGRKLMATFFVVTPQLSNLRQFGYTFMLAVN